MSATEYAIGRHCGVTFAGLKIASLVSLRKGEEDVIQTLSRRFAGKGFAFILLREDEERLLVYICHRAQLEKYLFSPDVRAFLARFGYEYGSAEEALEQCTRSAYFSVIRCVTCAAFCAIRTVVSFAARGRCTKMRAKRRARSSGSAVVLPASAGIWTGGGLCLRYLM